MVLVPCFVKLISYKKTRRPKKVNNLLQTDGFVIIRGSATDASVIITATANDVFAVKQEK